MTHPIHYSPVRLAMGHSPKVTVRSKHEDDWKSPH